MRRRWRSPRTTTWSRHSRRIEPIGALGERILPGAVRGREDFHDAHALHPVPELLAVDPVTIAQEIGGCGVVRERLHDLLGCPLGGGVLGDVEVDDGPAIVGEHDEDE
jgi:hypothetical protein